MKVGIIGIGGLGQIGARIGVLHGAEVHVAEPKRDVWHLAESVGTASVVAGANGGTGKEAAARLAAAGTHVVMAVRTPAKGEQARTDILARNPEAQLEVRRVDLADLASVRTFTDGLLTDGTPVDVLANNAGVMAPPTRMTTDATARLWTLTQNPHRP
ncbi:hypothetical protein GCM10022221_63300 [Actinocorallia aurea]